MNTQATQFYVAVIAILGIVLLTGFALFCAAFGDQERSVVSNVLLLFVGGLIGYGGTAVAYLFRLNGKATMSGTGDPPAPKVP